MEQTWKYRITVFTPTYNRAYILENLYRSLQRQGYTDFEWLVVDDGSSDGTDKLFDAWQKEDNPFPIRYVHQENGGKCRAINHGLELARGELFFTVDSDDYLTDDALEKVDRWEKELPRDGNFCGFVGNMSTGAEPPPDTLLPGGFLDGTSLDRYNCVKGERAFIFYTQIHRSYPYPVFPGETFMTESVSWDQMANDGYRLRFYNEVLTIYEYQSEGLTNSGYDLFLRNPRGTGLWFRQKAEFLHYPLRTKLGMWYGYVCDTMDMMTDGEIAESIAMPKALVAPMRWTHILSHKIRKKR